MSVVILSATFSTGAVKSVSRMIMGSGLIDRARPPHAREIAAGNMPSSSRNCSVNNTLISSRWISQPSGQCSCTTSGWLNATALAVPERPGSCGKVGRQRKRRCPMPMQVRGLVPISPGSNQVAKAPFGQHINGEPGAIRLTLSCLFCPGYSGCLHQISIEEITAATAT